jgi:predicted pyridoxine 5'-phosphate oxidase superfamily flavin-nucleotide-binding protein
LTIISNERYNLNRTNGTKASKFRFYAPSIWHAQIVENDPQILDRVRDPDYQATVERAIVFEIEGWDWNCPQHIPVRYSVADVETLQARIQQLENLLAAANNS